MLANLSKYFKGDKTLWIIILLLVLISIPTVYSTTGSLAYKYQGGNTAYYFIKHSFFVILGFIVIFVSHRVSYKLYFNIATAGVILSIFLLLLTLVIGKSVNDASRWLRIPIIGLDFQTSDLAKITLIIFVAKILSVNQETKENLKKAFFIILGVTGGVLILILPANLSTTLLLGLTIFVMMVIGRLEKKYLISMIAIAAVVFTLFLLVVMNSGADTRVGTWKARIENFSSDDSDVNFQSDQSKIAVAMGGWFGVGAGNSVQRNILPHPYSDFIYSIIIEEYGFIGGLVVLSLYVLILFRGIVIVKRSQRTFPAFLAVGLSTIIVFQALINMGVAVGILPVTGQPLPLISMGGTSTLMTCFSLGILLNISQKEETKTVEEKQEEEKIEVQDYPFLMG